MFRIPGSISPHWNGISKSDQVRADTELRRPQPTSRPGPRSGRGQASAGASRHRPIDPKTGLPVPGASTPVPETPEAVPGVLAWDEDVAETTGNWLSGWDSNPRDPFGAYSLSRGAPSTARPPLRGGEYPFVQGVVNGTSATANNRLADNEARTRTGMRREPGKARPWDVRGTVITSLNRSGAGRARWPPVSDCGQSAQRRHHE